MKELPRFFLLYRDKEEITDDIMKADTILLFERKEKESALIKECPIAMIEEARKELKQLNEYKNK